MKTIQGMFKIRFSVICRVFALVVIAIFATGGWSTVSAHDVQPTKTDPADGTALPQTPAKITVWFPEEVVAEKSTLQVFNAQGKQVDSGKGGVDLNDATHQVMVVNLPALPNGIYLVKWSIGLTDGDSSEGSFNIGIGNVAVPTTAPAATETVTPVTAVDPTALKPELPIPWIAGGVVVVLMVLVAVYLLARRG
jgi:methionine-rich copper-binding protein CopC